MRVLALCTLTACGRVGFDTNLGDADVEPPDLVLHAAFDSDGLLRDRARGHELTCTACPLQVAGRIDEAGMFDGTHCIVVTDANDLRPATFTLAAWVLTVGNQDGAVIGRPLNGTTDSSDTWMMYIGGGGVWRLEYNGADILLASTSADTWHHMAATYDGAVLTMYSDGSVSAGPMAVGVPQYTSEEMMIGCDRDFGGIVGNWHGLLDDVRLYGRALTADEIAALASL